MSKKQTKQPPEEVVAALKAGQVSPFYALTGEEPYYIDLITKLIETTVLPEQDRSFNQIVMYGKDVGTGQVINQARRFPMTSARQVVIVKEAQGLSDLNKQESQQLLLNYAEKPLPSTILVLAYKKKADMRGWWKKLAEKTVFVASEKVRDYQLNGWLQTYFKNSSHQADPRAIQMLADNIGPDLSRLNNEIEKITINLKSGEVITPQLVEKYVGISKEYNVFEWQKAFAQRNAAKAYQMALYFGANSKQNPLPVLLVQLFNYFTKLVILHKAGSRSDNELAGLIGVHPFILKEYQSAARAYPLPQTLLSIRQIRKADLKMKGLEGTSYAEEAILMELTAGILGLP